jgi:hypothetical protein
MECQTLEQTKATPSQELDQLEAHVQSLLVGRVRAVRLVLREDGLILHGRAMTYYAKQLAQHAVMTATTLPLAANEIEVS